MEEDLGSEEVEECLLEEVEECCQDLEVVEEEVLPSWAEVAVELCQQQLGPSSAARSEQCTGPQWPCPWHSAPAAPARTSSPQGVDPLLGCAGPLARLPDLQ